MNCRCLGACGLLLAICCVSAPVSAQTIPFVGQWSGTLTESNGIVSIQGTGLSFPLNLPNLSGSYSETGGLNGVEGTGLLSDNFGNGLLSHFDATATFTSQFGGTLDQDFDIIGGTGALEHFVGTASGTGTFTLTGLTTAVFTETISGSVAAVPEPGAWALLLTGGVAGSGFLFRRRLTARHTARRQ